MVHVRPADVSLPGLLGLLVVACGCSSCHHEAPAASPAAETSAAPAPDRPSASPVEAEGLERVATVELPGGAPGVGFDDLRFSPALDRVLVPAGRTGRLDLIDPATRAVQGIAGFAEKPTHGGGHDDSVTSADVAEDVLYATDRTTQQLAVVDPQQGTLLRSVDLAAHPDYVRHVDATGEVWVTEPDADQLEVFTTGDDGRHPAHEATIVVEGGPESLVVDPGRGRAYTHLWRGATVAVDVASRALVAHWDNGCDSSRGIALDAEHGLLVAACAEGRAVVLDVEDGSQLSELDVGAGVDVIAYDSRSRHLYLPSARTGTLTVASLSTAGELSVVGTVDVPRGAHCVTTDRRGNAYVCDPAHGQLVVIHDAAAAAAHATHASGG